MNRRIVSFLLALALVLGSIPDVRAEQFPEEEAVPAETSGEVTWDLTDGVLTISGTGPMEDYKGKAPWYTDFSDITTVIIEEGVTSIGNNAFFQLKKLTSVTIPNTVTSIGELAFRNCSELTQITIPGSVKEIGEEAFYNCRKLEKVSLGSGLETIGMKAFMYDNSLTEIIIPDTVTTIGKQAFTECSALKDVSLPSNLTKLGESAFYRTAITSIRIPDTLTVIGSQAFRQTKLTKVTIPDSVTVIEGHAFANCEDLEAVNLGSKLTTIGQGAFSGCKKLAQLELPQTLTEFGASAFADTGLTEITIPEGILAVPSYAFAGCTELRHVSLPESVVEIQNNAFGGCSALQEIALPSNLVSIGEYAFRNAGLKEIRIPDSVTKIDNDAFSNCAALKRIRLSDHMTEISDYLFYRCSSLEEVIVPRRITRVGFYAFWNCTSLESIALPGVTLLGANAFEKCTGLTSIHFGQGLAEVQSGASFDCNDLTDVYYEGSEEQWKEVEISPYSNDPLLNATYHYNVPIPAQDYYTLGMSSNNRTFEIKMPKVLQLDISLQCNGVPVTDWKFPSVRWAKGKELAQPQWEKRDDVWRLTLIPLLVGEDTVTLTDPKSGETLKFQIKITSDRLESCLDNTAIRINGRGNGYAYFKGEANQIYYYYKDGVADYAISDDKGLIEILLGTFETPGTYRIPLEFYKVNEQPMEYNQKHEAVVTVTPLEFSQQWEFSLEAGMGVAVGGMEVKLGDFEAKAALGQFSAKAGNSTALSMTRTWTDGKQDLELTSTHGVKAGAGIQCGVTGKYKALDVDLANISQNAEATGTVTYGIRIRDYSTDNPEQQMALAAFLLGEALYYTPNNYLAKTVYEKLTKNAYNHQSIDVVDGSGAVAAGVFDAGLCSLQVDVVDVFSELSGSVEGSVSISQRSYDNGEKAYTTAFTSQGNMSAVSGALSQGVLNVDYLGKDITVEVQKTGQGQTLRTTSLSAQEHTVTGPSLGKEYTSEYNCYLFAEDALLELRRNSTNLGQYLDGQRIALGNKDLVEIAEVISTCEADIAYSRLQKTQMIHSLPLSLGLELGVGADVEAALSYVQTVEHTTGTGFAVEDQILLSGRSHGIDDTVKAHVVSLDQLISDSMASVASGIADFFHKASDSVKNGVHAAQAWIDGKADSVHNWIVSITGPKDEEDGGWKSSETVQVMCGGRSVSAGTEAAATVGRPYLIQVTQADTGKVVEDLQADPLTLTVSYTRQELAAAGADAEAAVALYRYDAAGDLFIYTDCSHDPEAMTVTAEIFVGGQYILAVPGEAPETPPVEEETFQWEGASVSLGNSLDLSFFLLTEDALEGAYGKITRTYADGREDHVVTVPIQRLETQQGRMYVTYQGIAAKEMGDTVTAVICDKQGNVIGSPCTDSIQGYAMRQLEKTDNSELQTLLVDMLNYGAEAQKYFGYDAEHPVNGQLTEAQKGYATAEVQTQSILDTGVGRVATALTLKNQINLDFFFSGSVLGEDFTGYYALADFTNHYNMHMVVRINGADFRRNGDSSIYVPVSSLAVADYGQAVICTVYDAQGNALAWACDSIEGYAHRMRDRLPDIVEAVVKFGASSYKYFH